ncbi:pseudouridylate synthase RPUSD2 isoform X1 [Hemicordylus capensis]|uniref:pseudouridylate synthase RPUSD2 isoform X1 n=1 Tax=Hemicordylus capensis TaxID=884348 RepID=UPI002303E284|nr:pseudouridylate synthase RPUSD2 isoform X1 [Hemicordylus capensis]
MLLVRLQRLDQLPLVLLSFARGFRARPLLAFLAGESMEEKPVVPEASERGGSPPPAKKRRLLRAGREKQPGLPEEGEKRYVPPPKKRNPGVSFSDAHFAETTYYFESGLRKVRPYFFDFQTYCKGRWVGKSLLHVFGTEFRAQPLEYYRAASAAGRLRLNEQPVRDLGVVLKNNDFLRNTVHRHEPPVTAQAIEFLEENDEVVVVDKPSSLPVHPCGRFRHNTVIFILGKDYNLKELHTVHRLDRLTSGVLMFAKSAEVSKRIDQQVRQRQLEKEYVCRVLGEFPENEVTCEEPILVVSYKVGVCRVDPKGKFCKTVFQRLSYNGKTSVVKCFPYTGRTHQIRVHLQFLGHPIVNDPIYNTEVWGPEKGKGGNINKTDEELLRALVEGHISKQNLGLLDIAEEDLNLIVGNKEQDTSMNAAKSVQVTSVSVDPCNAEEPKCERECGMLTPSQNSVPQIQVPEPKSGETGSNELEDERDPLCRECKLVRPDPSPKDLVMYLHALRYKGADFEYCSKVPAWAQDDWEET